MPPKAHLNGSKGGPPKKAFFDPKNVIFPIFPILTSVGGPWDRNPLHERKGIPLPTRGLPRDSSEKGHLFDPCIAVHGVIAQLSFSCGCEGKFRGDSLYSADCKRGWRKGATSKNVKNRQKVSKSFSTLFDNFRAGQKTSKIVKKCQKVFRHFSTIFARPLFSGPFCNPLMYT